MAVYVPNREDIVHLQFEPASAHEMKGKHFGLVISQKVFNQRGLE
jgi:mRNA interferase ChpB